MVMGLVVKSLVQGVVNGNGAGGQNSWYRWSVGVVEVMGLVVSCAGTRQTWRGCTQLWRSG